MSKSESAAASEERAKKEEALRRAALDEKTLFGHVFPGADTVFDQTVAPNGVQVDDILKQVVRMKMKQVYRKGHCIIRESLFATDVRMQLTL